jgi:hypothetical protein
LTQNLKGLGGSLCQFLGYRDHRGKTVAADSAKVKNCFYALSII